jgi:hypothetical protein
MAWRKYGVKMSAAGGSMNNENNPAQRNRENGNNNIQLNDGNRPKIWRRR